MLSPSRKIKRPCPLAMEKVLASLTAIRALAPAGTVLRAHVARVLPVFIPAAHPEPNQILTASSPVLQQLSLLYREWLHQFAVHEPSVARVLKLLRTRYPFLAETADSATASEISGPASFLAENSTPKEIVHYQAGDEEGDCEQIMEHAQLVLDEIRNLFQVAGQQGLVEIAEGSADGFRDTLRDIWARLSRVEFRLGAALRHFDGTPSNAKQLDTARKIRDILNRIDAERDFCLDINVPTGYSHRTRNECEDCDVLSKSLEEGCTRCTTNASKTHLCSSMDDESDFEQDWEEAIVIAEDDERPVTGQLTSTDVEQGHHRQLEKLGPSHLSSRTNGPPLTAAHMFFAMKSRDIAHAVNADVLHKVERASGKRPSLPRDRFKIPPVRSRLKARLNKTSRGRYRRPLTLSP